MDRPRLIGGAVGLALVLVMFFVPGGREAFRAFFGSLTYVLPVLVGVMALVFLPRYRKSARLNEEGLEALSRGHVFAALEKFEAARVLAQSRVVTTYNAGLCRLYLWQLAEAERELVSVWDREDLTPEFRAIVLQPLALVAALDGRMREALRRLDEAKERKADSAPLTVLAAAVFECRRGDWARAKALLEREECLALAGTSRGLRDALLAWSVERLGGERRHVEPLALFGEASPDKLQAAWPELVSFVLERVHSKKVAEDWPQGK